jgi:(E)-4-hydroxy-3-methylbut-2-enyl-diphosphate synthase
MSVALGDPYRPTRRLTRIVKVGDIEIGAENPIRIQSMTNTDTLDTAATVGQIQRLVEAGCEIVRLTAPSIRDAENLSSIRRELSKRRIRVPLVADIHFTPNAAMIAANLVEKVRINPGNYADKKKFEVREYSDSEYQLELDRVGERFRPLVRRCRTNGVAMRIGTNHGSLSDRIMNRFGDTPEGMVESALEFLDVCEDERYYDVIFSMKASSTQVAIAAYRLLAARLEEHCSGRASYPFHVGVTEAGDAEDGRIKSAIGIGSLLEDGLGDTIRVSLTEDPVVEVPVARAIAERAERVRQRRQQDTAPILVSSKPVADPFAHQRRASESVNWGALEVGGEAPIRVEIELDKALNQAAETAARLAVELSGLRDIEAESLLVCASGPDSMTRVGELRRELDSVGLELPISLRVAIEDHEILLGAASAMHPLARWVVGLSADSTPSVVARFADAAGKANAMLEWELRCAAHELPGLVGRALQAVLPMGGSAQFSLAAAAPLHDYRVLVSSLADAGAARAPIVLRHRLEAVAKTASDRVGTDGVSEATLLDASVRLGSLLCDGIGDAVSMQSEIGAAPAVDLAYRILQGARRRTTRTEYISCPSCGRTLFDLEETTARIKAKTDHLRGVKIAIMGCIVNGPGEMADADFGYVGSGVGQVTLYVGKQIVARAVPESLACDRLVELIREQGQWLEEEEDGL